MMILGYGVPGTPSAAIASSETEENWVEPSEVLPRAELTPAAATTDSNDLAGEAGTATRPSVTGDSLPETPQGNAAELLQRANSAIAPERPPNPQSQDTDSSVSPPIIIVESNLPNTETVLNAFGQAIASASDVQFSDLTELDAETGSAPPVTQRGNAAELLQRINNACRHADRCAIAHQQSPPAQIVAQEPVLPSIPPETVVVVESTLPNAQTVLSAFEAAATTSEDIKVSTYNSADLLEDGAIANAPNQPPTPLSADSFTPFERILSQVRRHQPVPKVTATEPQPLTREGFTPFASVLDRASRATTTALSLSSNDVPPESPTLTNVLPESNAIVEAFKTVFQEMNTADSAVTTAPDAIAQNNSIIPNAELETPAPTEIEKSPENPTATPRTPDNQNPSTRELMENPSAASTLDSITPTEPLAPNVNPLLRPTEIDDVIVDITKPITLTEAVTLALRNNPTLRQTKLELNVARESLREANASEYPTLSTLFNFTRSDSAQPGNGSNNNSSLLNQLGVNNSNDPTSTTAEGRLELSYNVYTGGRRSAQISAAERSVRLNQLEVERITVETKFDTLQAYYAVQEADAQVEIAQASVEDAQRSLRDAQLLEEAGLGTRFDVLQAQVQLANNTQNLTNARSQQEISQRQLAVVLGLGQEAEVLAADEIETAGTWDYSLEETLLLAYQNRAELEQNLVQREINEQQRQIALADIKPQVSVFANYNVLGITGDNQGLGDGYTFGARMQWTLFDGGAAQARAAQQATNIEISETQFDQQLDQIRLEVEQAYRSLLANQENIQTASVALQLAQESLRLARLRFGAGVGTQTEVINAQTELARARGNLLTAIIDYNRDLSSLQRAVTNLPDNRLFDLPE